MKNRIVITTNNHGNLDFYLEIPHKKLYLFTEKFSLSVYRFFYNGRFENEIKSFKGWKNHGFRLCKTISKLPMYIRYALKEEEYYNLVA